MKSMIKKQSESRKRISLNTLLTVVAIICAVIAGDGVTAQAEARSRSERYVLDFQDMEVRGGSGHHNVLFLKQTLKEQYPWVDLRDLDLRSVELVAKSRVGKGGAQLRVGEKTSEIYRVDGVPWQFDDAKRYTFDRLRFENPVYDSRGPWQINLKGNFVVRKVILEVDDRAHRRPYPRYYGWYGHR